MVVSMGKLCVALLLYVVISSLILREAHGILPSDNLLKAIAKTIERYEEGELPKSTTIHFHYEDDGQKRIENLFLPGNKIWDPLHSFSNAVQGISSLYPNRKLIRQCFVHYYFTNENLYNARMSSFTGTWLSSDHTFKVAGNVGMWQSGKWIRSTTVCFLL